MACASAESGPGPETVGKEHADAVCQVETVKNGACFWPRLPSYSSHRFAATESVLGLNVADSSTQADVSIANTDASKRAPILSFSASTAQSQPILGSFGDTTQHW